jgi:hypothetical protein
VLHRFAFLKVLGATVLWPLLDRAQVFAAINYLVPAETATAAPQLDLLFATAEAFRGHLDTTFLVRAENGARAAVRLASVAEGPRTANVEQFSLTFHAPDGAGALQGICAFDHRTLGRFDAFVVAIGAATARPIVYEACFSRTLNHG